jgi:hypothetical protein
VEIEAGRQESRPISVGVDLDSAIDLLTVRAPAGHALHRSEGMANGNYILQCFCGFDTAVQEDWSAAARVFNQHLSEYGLAPVEEKREKPDPDPVDGGPHGLAGPGAATNRHYHVDPGLTPGGPYNLRCVCGYDTGPRITIDEAADAYNRHLQGDLQVLAGTEKEELDGHAVKRWESIGGRGSAIYCYCGFETGLQPGRALAVTMLNAHLAAYGLSPMPAQEERTEHAESHLDPYSGGPHGLASSDPAA